MTRCLVKHKIHILPVTVPLQFSVSRNVSLSPGARFQTLPPDRTT